MSDPIDDVRALAPRVRPSPELLARARSTLTMTIDATSHDRPRTDRPVVTSQVDHPPRASRWRRRWVIPVAAAGVLATSAAGWALTRSDGPATGTIGCSSRAGETTIIRAVTGDPVADCAAEIEALTGAEAPPLAAYVHDDGSVLVLSLDQAPLEGFTPLAPGTETDLGLVEFLESLQDEATGLPSGCLDEDAARAEIEAELRRLGLDGWTVAVESIRPIETEHPCARPIADPSTRTVTLYGVEEPGSGADPFIAYARDLEEELAATCTTLDGARAVAERLAAETVVAGPAAGPSTVAEAGLDVVEVETPDRECTTSTVSVGGRVDVTLRGPIGG